MAVVETVERTERNLCGQILPVVITHRVGLDTYTERDGKPFLADEATFMDFGPKYGVQRSYIMHPETPPTQKEREAGRAMIRSIAVQAMIEQRIW